MAFGTAFLHYRGQKEDKSDWKQIKRQILNRPPWTESTTECAILQGRKWQVKSNIDFAFARSCTDINYRDGAANSSETRPRHCHYSGSSMVTATGTARQMCRAFYKPPWALHCFREQLVLHVFKFYHLNVLHEVYEWAWVKTFHSSKTQKLYTSIWK